MQSKPAIDKEQNRRQKEAREIAKWERLAAKPQGHAYFFYLIFVICVIYISDEVASQIGTQMQSVVAQALFAPVFGEEKAVARMSAFSSVGMVLMVFSFMYKPLSDRFGRRIFLITNTLGMGAGLLLISVSSNIPVYLLGTVVVNFFTPHDMQRIYILETVPPERRATWYAFIKAIATLGMMLIPLMRDAFMGSDISRWHYVYMAPGILAVVIAVFAACFVRETHPFMKRRLTYLRSSDEERAAAKQDKSAANAQGGLLSAARFIMKNKQLRWLLLGNSFIMWGMVITSYYETTMTYGYASPFLLGGQTLEAAKAAAAPLITEALFLFPVGSAFFQLIQGFLSDKWGRKPTVIVMSVCAVMSFTLFFYGANHGWNPYLTGLLCGSAVGSYWASGDICGIMCSESTPTNLRASVLSVQPIISGVISAVVIFAPMLILNAIGDKYAGPVSLAFAVPGLVIGFMLIMLKTRETKNVDLEEISGREE